jgi:hypothetical protein
LAALSSATTELVRANELTLWVVRVPFAGVLIGVLFLSLVPQAQDLFVERAVSPAFDIVVPSARS